MKPKISFVYMWDPSPEVLMTVVFVRGGRYTTYNASMASLVRLFRVLHAEKCHHWFEGKTIHYICS